jgi:beta-glucosidase
MYKLPDYKVILFCSLGTLYGALQAAEAQQLLAYAKPRPKKLTTLIDTSCNCPVKTEAGYAAYQRQQEQQVMSVADSLLFRDLPAYLNPALPIEQRITDLLPRLTLEEKVIQLSDSWGSKGIARLRVPAMLKTEGLHGQSYATGSTIFPHAIAMATTFDTALIHLVGKTTALEAKAANLRSSWSPVLDVARDARWGRVEETYGEDPYLVSRMGVAWINGFQGENMIAVPKHFAGHGEPLGGRDSHDVGLSDRTMRNVHLVPFRAAIREAKAGGVMAAYSTWDGVPDNGSIELLQKILREEWGFDGIVVSDCSGPENFLRKQNVVTDLEQASRMAILAGVDIECGSAYTKALASAVNNGVLKESDLDANLRRVFRVKYRLGLFENPGSDKMVWDKLPQYDVPAHRALARKVATEGSVLLKNAGNILPLSKTLGTIAIIGPNAAVAQTGDYSAKSLPGQLISVLDGVKNHVGSATQVLYAKGCGNQSKDSSGFAEAVAVAAKADAVILVVGDYSTREFDNSKDKEKATTGENVDGATLEIPGVQRQLIRRIQATGKPVILVLVNGKPFTLNWEDENVAAILETWYPGEEGGNATADLIFGDVNPSGRLPISFPRHVGQLPLHYDYEPSGRNYDYYDMPFTPLYRFGHGLSYTTFKYSNLKTTVSAQDITAVTVSVDLENTGNRDGAEVAQLYLTNMLTPVITPVIELKGMQRVELKKGEKKTISFQLTPYQLSLLDADMHRIVTAGKYRVHIGGVSPEPVTGSVEHKKKTGFTNPAQGISGEFNLGRAYSANFVYDVKVPATAKGGEAFPVTVIVTNKGGLTDIADLKLFADSLLNDVRFELDPGQSVTHTFTTALYTSGRVNLSVLAGNKNMTRTIDIAKAPAKMVLGNERSVIGTDGVLHYTAEAVNTGSSAWSSKLAMEVDGREVATQPVVLQAGERKPVKIDYLFPHSGNFKVKVSGGAPQQVVVPGGVSLALQNPLLYLSFDNKDKAGLDKITGTVLSVEGKPQYVPGKNGLALQTNDKATFVKAGSLDLYRKSFTLAAWVNITAFDNGQAMFFGGQAPMGADIDNTGTALAAGTLGENLLSSFQDRDIRGGKKLPAGQWAHVAYTYNAQKEQGALYIDGKLDKSAPQKAYAGPLEMIGSSSRFAHGKFAIDEVLVTRSCLSAEAIGELAAKNAEALRKGTITTEWKAIASPVTALKTWSDLPAGTTLQVTIETAGQDGKVTDTKLIQVKTGEQQAAVPEMKAGTQVRLRIDIASDKWDAVPFLKTVELAQKQGSVLRWSTVADWSKATRSGGVSIIQ